jgi:hypothetical protein
MTNSIEWRLEQYTIKRPQEVLMVTAEVAGVEDQIAIFRGYSSSLVRSTPFDADVPLLPDEAKIISIDRLAAPYNPEAPRYLQPGLTWEAMEAVLLEVGV